MDAGKTDADEPIEPGPTVQCTVPTDEAVSQVKFSPTQPQQDRAACRSVITEKVSEPTDPAEALDSLSRSAAKKWTGLREAKALVSTIHENPGLQLAGTQSMQNIQNIISM